MAGAIYSLLLTRRSNDAKLSQRGTVITLACGDERKRLEPVVDGGAGQASGGRGAELVATGGNGNISRTWERV